jgi:hypothetical protein
MTIFCTDSSMVEGGDEEAAYHRKIWKDERGKSRPDQVLQLKRIGAGRVSHSVVEVTMIDYDPMTAKGLQGLERAGIAHNMSSTANRINESLANISHRLSPMSHVPTISTTFMLPPALKDGRSDVPLQPLQI